MAVSTAHATPLCHRVGLGATSPGLDPCALARKRRGTADSPPHRRPHVPSAHRRRTAARGHEPGIGRRSSQSSTASRASCASTVNPRRNSASTSTVVAGRGRTFPGLGLLTGSSGLVRFTVEVADLAFSRASSMSDIRRSVTVRFSFTSISRAHVSTSTPSALPPGGPSISVVARFMRASVTTVFSPSVPRLNDSAASNILRIRHTRAVLRRCRVLVQLGLRAVSGQT